MHPNSDDLSGLERQLIGCRPTAEGLNADAMLFAAGLAAAPRPSPVRWAWPIAACSFAIACIVLAGGWRSERTRRLELAARLAPPINQAARPAAPTPAEPPLPGSYWSVRRLMEKDGETWTAQANRSLAPSVEIPKAPSPMRAWPTKSMEP